MLSGATTRGRFFLFGGLYFAQGVPWGFFAVALQLRLTGLGLTPGELGHVLMMAWLPWAAKPVLGPLVDRVNFGRFGRRRPFVVLAEVGMAGSLVLMALVDPARSLPLFAGFILVHNAFAAAQDVGVDALALDLLTPNERGRANGIMVAGKYGGVVVGGQGLLWMAARAGWSAAFAAAIVLLLIPAALILQVRESEAPPVRPPLVRLLFRSFAVRVVVLAVVFAFVVDISDGLLTPMMFPLLKKQLGFSDQQIALLATLSGLLGVGGSLLGGFLCDRLGRRRALFIGCVAVAATNFAFAATRTLWGHYAFLVAFGLAGALASGMVSVATVALFMDLTNRRLGATQFQVYMSVMNLRTSGTSYLGGQLADRLSPPTMFNLAGVLELLPLAMLPFLDARRAQRRFSETEAEQDEAKAAPPPSAA